MTPYYEQSGICIYHGDCREVLPDVWFGADAVITDPPYGINFAGQPTDYQRLRGQQRESWDKEPFDNINVIVNAAPRVCIWGGNYYSLPISRGWIAWVKPDAPPSMGNVELAWTNLDKNGRHIQHSIAATNRERVGHPTQKPLPVMRFCIGYMVSVPALIIDPFAGSGTTLVAAKQMGHRAIGIEIDERYCELAALRLQQEVLPLEVSA